MPNFWHTHLQVHNETVQLHLVAALQSLHRESELLPAPQREVLMVMLREHGLTAGVQSASSQPPMHRRSFTGSSDGSISSGHLVASNQSSPGLPRAHAGLTRRQSDAAQLNQGSYLHEMELMLLLLHHGFCLLHHGFCLLHGNHLTHH